MTTAPTGKVWRPNSEPQETFLAYGGFEGGYGGAASGGKSEALLVDALYGINHPNYRAILFRRTFDELRKTLIDRARKFYPYAGGTEHKTDHVWTFRSGAQIAFSHMKDRDDYKRFDSTELQFVGFDEATSFYREQVIFMASRLRSSQGIRPRLRWASNPGGVGHDWVFARYAPWLDTRPEYTGPRARFGEVLYFLPNPNDPEGDGDVVPRGTPGALPRTFVRSLPTDNPATDPQYLDQLDLLDRVTRAQKKHGDWLIKPGKGLYFQRSWWGYLDEAPPRSSWRRAVRAWDFSGSKTGDWTVGVLYAHVPTCITPWVIVDMIRFRDTPGGVLSKVLSTAEADGKEVEIFIPQDPGQAGKYQADDYVAKLAGYAVKTERPTGNKVTRAKPHSPQVEHGHVALVRAAWNNVLVEEHQDLPEGEYDDIVDATSDGFNHLNGTPVTPPYSFTRVPSARR
jgi:predicted phage terminase large subunit-like protein